ncbi:DUF3140 domain-containing protein [Aurantiacibacter gangjinensis]|uniref:DNA-binding protein n=1 Tax=Aurantiacibacter gangjinensis TaxID=502682 RepID=A0A0G9MMM0_9SPHN|nr:DUF3140 domain-containing protein [Aurantiacibacter gangjinensis]APE28003.1 putative DNA-binding protein [Aurantiacibacter gangjinensis]KLE31940.1 DNA-binding protein [Aurantiacibacter gangjinensis]
MADRDRDETYDEFYDCVNMQPKELEEWLDTEESKSVGDSDDGESTGHKSGRRIVDIKRTNKDELTDEQWDHMDKVIGYIHRHLSQEPDGDIEETDWRYSLMNWGHDPMKDE